MSDRRTFKRLKAFMARHNLGRDETAKKLATPVGTFKHWLTGHHKTPGVLTAFLDVLEHVPEARRHLGIQDSGNEGG